MFEQTDRNSQCPFAAGQPTVPCVGQPSKYIHFYLLCCSDGHPKGGLFSVYCRDRVFGGEKRLSLIFPAIKTTKLTVFESNPIASTVQSDTTDSGIRRRLGKNARNALFGTQMPPNPAFGDCLMEFVARPLSEIAHSAIGLPFARLWACTRAVCPAENRMGITPAATLSPTYATGLRSVSVHGIRAMRHECARGRRREGSWRSRRLVGATENGRVRMCRGRGSERICLQSGHGRLR